ncbi:MAG: peptidoglycan editing factor PgeF [Acidaminococcales bacterium]|nr:peptidoglycan editing factor PgeF [Acidaminococcales bacterium]
MKSEFVLKNIDGIWFGLVPALYERGIKHAFTSKFYGESVLEDKRLNMSFNVGDSEDCVLANRRRVCAALGIDFERLTAARQAHGDNRVYVDEGLLGRGNKNFAGAIAAADALVTDLPGVPLLLLFADCVPVVLADPAKKLVAVVHAGWRGTTANVLRKTAEAFRDEFSSRPKDCVAVIGPSIGPECYKVGREVYRAARDNLSDYQKFFQPAGENEWQFDLWQANKAQLEMAGVKTENIFISGICTKCHRELFFSHRAEKGRAGRFAAIAWL